MTDLTPHADLRPVRLVLYSHDSLGLGHLRRNMALAHAFAEHLPGLLGRPVTGLLVTGLDTPAGRLPSGFDVVRLPGVAKGRHGYEPRDVHVPMDDLIGVRSEVLSGMLSSFAPDLVIVDRHPFGVDEELLVPLQRLRAERPATRIVLGLREVLDDPAVAAREWESVGIARVRHHVDAVWIYGDEDITDPRSTGELPATLHDLARSTGYLSLGRAGFADPAHHVPPYVLTTVGGGADGVEVCLAAAAAQVSTRHVVVTGPQMGEADRERVRAAARPGTEVLTHLGDALSSITGAAAVVCMGGYNTISEVLSTDVPALVVPRSAPRLEQTIRARALAAVGAVDTMASDDVTSETVARWIAEAVTADRSLLAAVRGRVDCDGLMTVAGYAADLLRCTEVAHAG